MSDDQRRQHARVPVRLSAEVQTPDGTAIALTKDLSAGGAALECDRPLADGEAFRLSLFLVYEGIEDERTPPLIVGARVMWTGESDDGAHLAGIRFESISQAQVDWLNRVLAIAAKQA